MSARLFERSGLGDDERLGDDQRLECGICWYVYDPAEGDEVWQIEPGTPFSALPEHWRCPRCDAEKPKFMLYGEAAAPPLAERMAAAYAGAAERLRDLPIYNPALEVSILPFRRSGERQVGIVITPWFMNLTVVPDGDEAGEWRDGRSVELDFPSGRYPFTVSTLDGVGPVATCPLFSPMFEFDSMANAQAAAEAALAALFEAPEAEASGQADRGERTVSRRALLFGG